MPKRRRNTGSRPLTDEDVIAACDVIVVCDMDELEARAVAAERNPSGKTITLAGAIGLGVVGGALAWWMFRRRAAASNAKGIVVCPTIPYPGPLGLGDYVVVELGNVGGTMSEPTWAKVIQRRGPDGVLVELVGERGENNQPVPLATDQHGYAIGDKLEILRSCVFDRFQLAQRWHVLCGAALAGTGYAPIERSQAQLLSVEDRAQVVVRGPRGGTEAVWLTVEHVSPGQQTISGVVLNQPVVSDHGLRLGDVVQFLRDCVVDAEFN